MRPVQDSIDDPSICVVRTAQGERITGQLAEWLNPVDPKTFHQYRLPANTSVELHFHDVDEYWWFVQGRPRITLRSANGVTRQFELGPGDLVACVRGVEHTLWADHELVYYQYSSVLAGGERPGHLTRQALA
jgi:mannose-6-phosphate isomerase-like protein (cupin superfamily)